MSKLTCVLTRLVAGARVGAPTSTTLPSGLFVSARLTENGLRCLLLTRTRDVAPSETEARVCAKQLGWPSANIATTTSRSGKPALLVWSRRVSAAPKPLPAPQKPVVLARTAPTGPGRCATCAHAEPEHNLLACTLGWPAHEQPVSSHPGVPRPLLSAGSRCMALGERWTARVAQ